MEEQDGAGADSVGKLMAFSISTAWQTPILSTSLKDDWVRVYNWLNLWEKYPDADLIWRLFNICFQNGTLVW